MQKDVLFYNANLTLFFTFFSSTYNTQHEHHSFSFLFLIPQPVSHFYSSISAFLILSSFSFSLRDILFLLVPIQHSQYNHFTSSLLTNSSFFSSFFNSFCCSFSSITFATFNYASISLG